MLPLRQVLDSLQVSFQQLAEMCLTAMGKSDNPPTCRVCAHNSIVRKHHSDPLSLPIPLKNMPATMYVPSTLLTHPVMYISAQGSWVELPHPQSSHDQLGMHFPSISDPGVTHSCDLILTTCLSSRGLLFGSSSMPHPVEHFCYQSGLHGSNCSQRTTVHWHHTFPSMSHPLDLQAHLKRATSYDTTSHRVNGIPGVQLLEVWNQFSHLSQLCSPQYVSSCTVGTDRKSQNSMYSARAGYYLMISL